MGCWVMGELCCEVGKLQEDFGELDRQREDEKIEQIYSKMMRTQDSTYRSNRLV